MSVQYSVVRNVGKSRDYLGPETNLATPLGTMRMAEVKEHVAEIPKQRNHFFVGSLCNSLF